MYIGYSISFKLRPIVFPILMVSYKRCSISICFTFLNRKTGLNLIRHQYTILTKHINSCFECIVFWINVLAYAENTMPSIAILKRPSAFSWHRLRWKENLYSSTDKRDGGNLLYFYIYNLPLGVCSASYELAKSISISHSWRLTLNLVSHLYMTQHSLHMTIRTNRFCT